jgi:Fur family transcriptional regulator, ferric uptake regulator
MKCASPDSVSSEEKRSPEFLLTHAGLRCTKERISTLHTLARLHTPCTVENLHTALGKHINKVTLYRMLEQFADANLVERVTHPDGVRRYEYQEEHHHHITCRHCGVRSTIHLSERGLVAQALASAPSFSRVTSHTAEFFGVCKRCTS